MPTIVNHDISDVVDFYDLQVSDGGLPTGHKNKGEYYHLSITDAEVGAWDDGRPRLDLRTEVVGGEYAGKFGPRHTFSIGGFEGHRANNGRAFTIEPAEQAATLIKFVQTVHPERIAFSKPVGRTSAGEYVGIDEGTLGEIAAALVDCEFIAKVKLDKKDYMRLSDVHAVGDPPDGFAVEVDSQPFTL